MVAISLGWSNVPQEGDSATLTIDNWDDYGFQTMFDLVVTPGAGGGNINVGKVKILQRGLRSGRPDLQPQFTALDSDYISLGQNHDYYENLVRLGRHIYEPLLTGLNDIVFNPALAAGFDNEPGLRTSLRRFSSAEAAEETARVLFGDEAVTDGEVELAIETEVGGSRFVAHFDWDQDGPLPGRLAALIGYNGAGKTQLLANIALVAARTGLSITEQGTDRGVLRSSTFEFSGVIAVSYSAFDTFSIPRVPGDAASSTAFGYTFIGLREHTQEGAADEYTLKSTEQLVTDFADAVRLATRRERTSELSEVLDVLAEEPSFVVAGLDSEMMLGPSGVDTFRRLSTGHKIVLNVATQLVAHLQPRTLVLIDEPETHLHPPLIAALLTAIRHALTKLRSLAIVATHSPVVLQEIPARHVRVIRRLGDRTTVDPLDVESFAENVGLLTRTVFNLDSSATDYQRVFRELTRSLSTDEVRSLFPFGVSSQGEALLASLKGDPPVGA